jgi:hypothetical protein
LVNIKKNPLGLCDVQWKQFYLQRSVKKAGFTLDIMHVQENTEERNTLLLENLIVTDPKKFFKGSCLPRYDTLVR